MRIGTFEAGNRYGVAASFHIIPDATQSLQTAGPQDADGGVPEAPDVNDPLPKTPAAPASLVERRRF